MTISFNPRIWQFIFTVDIGENARVRIVTLWQDARQSQRQVSKITGISQSSVNRIVKRYRETGEILPQRVGKCGRKRLSTSYEDRRILRASMIDPRLTALDIKKEIVSPLSVHTIRRRLIDGGRKSVKPIQKPLLTARMKQSRLQWARNHKDWTSAQWEKWVGLSTAFPVLFLWWLWLRY